ncbi:MAG: hypothetical protein ACI4U4_04040 [Bacilli bacterium]
MITIKKPKIKTVKNKAILTCEVLIDDKKEEIFYEIDKEYKEYLCTERADAFVIAALYYAMKHHHDITSELPITSEIYHNLTTYMIPTLAKHSNNLSIIKLNMPIISTPIKTKGEVGTGMSCGIDSLHTLKNYLNPECQDMKLTCLCLNNVGSFKAYDEKYRGMGSENARNDIIKRAEKISKEVGLPLIVTNSNVYKVFNDTYFRIHTFANMFSVFLMQKFFSKYYYASSGYDLSHYNVIDSHKLDSAEYDLLTFYSLGTSTLKIYPEGNEKNRLEKTIDLADFDLAQKYLHVCIKNSTNCGKCLKCKRTLLSLDAIGKLDNFKEVFDIDYYKNNKKEYYDWLEKEVENGSLMNTLTAKLLSQKNKFNEKPLYEDIEIYNKQNIVLPEVDILSISIKKDKYILNKNCDYEYNNDICYRLAVCTELAKIKNKEIKIPKYLLDNTKVYFKNQKTITNKIKYLKRIIRKNTCKIMLHDLIYFLLYKPSTNKNIIKFLRDEHYLDSIPKTYTKNSSTTKQLAEIFEKFLEFDVNKNALTIDKINIKNKVLKNNNFILKNQDIYYDNDEYQYSFISTDKDYYYFVGKSNNYIISIISYYNKNKNEVYEDISKGYFFIKKITKY